MLTPAEQSPPTVPGRALIGAISPTRQVVAARPIAQHADPDNVIATLRQMWRDTFARRTSAMLAALLAIDWQYLRAGDAAGHRPAAAAKHAVAGSGGIGMPSTRHRQHRPVSFCLAQPGDLAVDWIYLIDPVADTVAVYTGDGRPTALHRLTG
ncbi:hypothetical protein ACN27G_29065 [Plantactinospora sp. WMMB334]|uniref:hypothetical protein n=1 Tax=Plantactinospora sp. WMMB334 TaxID=3404119 RepID=UPI003B935ECA